MRVPLALTVLLVASLLAGCSDSPKAPDAPGDAGSATGDGFVPPGKDASLPRMRFSAPASNQSASFSDEFPNPDPCLFPGATSCERATVRFDLTPIVPPDAPIELAASIRTGDCVFAWLDVADADIYRMDSDEDSLAAILVRQAQGTVTLVLEHGLLCGDATASSNPVDVEVQTAVRPDVLRPYLPAFVHLAPGDRVVAMGQGADDVDDFIVIPPGLPAVHHLKEQSFNVTADLPEGDYVVMVTGGDAMLHGPNATLRPARFLHFIGEDREAASGQQTSWTTTVPGIPAYALLYLLTGEAGSLDNARVSYEGGYSLAIRQAGQELASDGEASCTAPGLPCTANGPGGQYMHAIGTGLFPEGMGLGELEFEVGNDISQGMHAYEVIGYIAA